LHEQRAQQSALARAAGVTGVQPRSFRTHPKPWALVAPAQSDSDAAARQPAAVGMVCHEQHAQQAVLARA
jgi:hypothetical protein